MSISRPLTPRSGRLQPEDTEFFTEGSAENAPEPEVPMPDPSSAPSSGPSPADSTTGASIPESAPEPEVGAETPPAPEPEKIAFTPNTAALNGSNGEPSAWASELARMISEVHGITFDPSSLESWFSSYRNQVEYHAVRSIALDIANLPVDPRLGGDASFQVYDFRGEMVRMIRHRAGI